MVKVTWKRLEKNPQILVGGTCFELFGDYFLKKTLSKIKENQLITVKDLSKTQIIHSRNIYLREHEAKFLLDKLVRLGLMTKCKDKYSIK